MFACSRSGVDGADGDASCLLDIEVDLAVSPFVRCAGVEGFWFCHTILSFVQPID